MQGIPCGDGKAAPIYELAYESKWEAINQRLRRGHRAIYEWHCDEGSGEKIFLVKDGSLHTPPFSSAVCRYHARSVDPDCAELGYEVKEEVISSRSNLLMKSSHRTAAELLRFAVSTRSNIGSGTRGPVTASSKKIFTSLWAQETPGDWLTMVNGAEPTLSRRQMSGLVLRQ